MKSENRELPPKMRDELLKILKKRFEMNMKRHYHFEWTIIEKRLLVEPKKLWSLNEMERTGGEPDIIGYDDNSGEYIFYDCSAESPNGRRNLCYDREAQESRKKNKPENNAIDMAAAMGLDILTVEESELTHQNK